MQKTKHWLMTIAALLCSIVAIAHDFEVDGIYYNITDATNLTVEVTYKGSNATAYSNEYSGAVTIPSTVTYNSKTYSVTSIGENAFVSCMNLTSITLPEGVTSIGAWAFAYCHSLTSITIPENLTSIDNYAFWNCTNLPSITIPENSQLASIGGYAFGGCSSLTFITLPESVTSIGEYAFIDCSSLTSFVSFSSVAPEINETNIFLRINADATLTIPYGSTSSYEDAGWLSHFASVVEMPLGGNDGNITWELTSDGELIIEGTGAMNDYAYKAYAPWYEYRSSITKVTIEEGVTSIGDYAFYGCSSLTTINIPESVTSIRSYAFKGCSNLASITIPESVTVIGYNAFSGCSSLTTITLPEGMTSIGDYAFSFCSRLTSINILENSRLTSIGNYAFQNCISLTSINLPTSVTSIGNYAFQDCSSLTTITIPEGVTSIGNGTFELCTNLKTITIPEGVTSIGAAAFGACGSLTSINLPASVTSIGGGAFEHCSSLTSITLPASVTSIEGYAFRACSSLTSFVSFSSVAPNINDKDVFQGINANATLTIPSGSTSSYEEAGWFSDFASVVEMPLGGNDGNITWELTSDGELIIEGTGAMNDYASPTYAPWYEYRSSITKVTIEEGVTSIGNGAFCGCSSLTFITSEALTPPTIEGSNTFEDVDLSIPVYVPASSVSAYQSAECWSEFTNIQTIPEAITINQYGSATYCSEYALDFSEVEGLKAYAATGYNTKTGVVTLTRVMTSQPGMGLFLKGEPGEYTVPTLESTDDNSLNMLVGTQESTMLNGTSDDGLYYNYRYTIKEGNEAPLFYQVDDGYTLGAGKAYLQIPAAWMPAEAQAIGLRFDEGGTTDIEEVESKTQDSALLFDLMGRRVVNPQKGMVYIANGKKIIW